jgi:hypothetical protein
VETFYAVTGTIKSDDVAPGRLGRVSSVFCAPRRPGFESAPNKIIRAEWEGTIAYVWIHTRDMEKIIFKVSIRIWISYFIVFVNIFCVLDAKDCVTVGVEISVLGGWRHISHRSHVFGGLKMTGIF